MLINQAATTVEPIQSNRFDESNPPAAGATHMPVPR